MAMLRTARQSVWTDSTTYVFIPLTEALTTAEVAEVLVAWEVMSATDTLETRPAFQLSNDGEVWTDSTNFPAAASTTAGRNFATAWTTTTDNTGTAKQLIRFGVLVKRTSGTTLAYARVQMAIQYRGGA